jgi:hypothetical protein
METPFCARNITPHPVALFWVKATPGAIVLIVDGREHKALLSQWADNPVDLSVADLEGFIHVIEPGIITLVIAGKLQALSSLLRVATPVPLWRGNAEMKDHRYHPIRGRDAFTSLLVRRGKLRSDSSSNRIDR